MMFDAPRDIGSLRGSCVASGNNLLPARMDTLSIISRIFS